MGTPEPSPRALALLATASGAVEELRRAEARVLHAVRALETAGVPAESGYPSTARLLTDHLRLDRSDARALVRQATLVCPQPGFSGGPVPPVLPASADSLNTGTIGRGHLAVIAETMRTLSRVPALPVEVLEETEVQLADLATQRTPSALARDAAQILLLLDPDGQLAPDADRPTQELHLSTGRHGELTGRFRFADPEAAQTVRTAIDALTPAPDPVEDTTPLRPGPDLSERRGAALHDLAADTLGHNPHNPHNDPDDPDPDPDGSASHRLFDDAPFDDTEHPGDDDELSDELSDAAPGGDAPDADPDRGVSAPGQPPPALQRPPPRRGPRTQGGDAVSLTVSVPLEVLEARLRGHGLLEGQWALTPETIRRLACDATVIPAVLGTRGEVLDLGRKTRTITAAQRRAVILRDRHCAHPGCHRPPRYCQVHHITPWSWDGPSDLDNLVLLCSRHHHLIHHSGWEIHMRDGIPTFTPPAWLDPLRTPRINRPNQVPAG